jgi:prepilin-type N-terminal cleavage/methylation domain-containing protein
MNRQAGLSLVEMLVVIALAGILTAIGGLGVRAMLDRAHLNEAIVTIDTQLAQARRLAKQQDRDITFTINQTSGVWQVAVDGRSIALPGNVSVTTGSVNLTLLPPFGTYNGPQFSIGLSARSASATATVTGVLAKMVVQR